MKSYIFHVCLVIVIGVVFNVAADKRMLTPKSRDGTCPAGKELCSDWWCYDPKEEVCKGDVPCSPEEESCGTNCYNPAEKKCVSREAQGRLCGLSEEGCGYVCYDPTTETRECVDNVALCPHGEKVCGRDQACYNPANKKCTDDGGVCEFSEESCGRKCFDPKVEKRVCTTGILCPAGQSNCNGQCYTAWHGSCNYKLNGQVAPCTYGYVLCHLRGSIPI